MAKAKPSDRFKTRIKQAVAVGDAAARAAVLARHAEAEARREVREAAARRAMRRVGKRSVEPFPETPSTSAALAVSAGTLVAEGDSWFDYPFFDVLKSLEDDFGFDVETVANLGDTVEDMAYGGGQLDNLIRRIEKLVRRGEAVHGVLLSGGGNDIAGDELATLLNHVRSGRSGLNDKVVEGIIDDRLADAYATILAAVTRVGNELLGAPPRIVVHGYDYPVPDGRGFAGGWWPLPGPWLEPSLRRKGYESLTQGTALMRTLIDRFNAMLQRVVSDSSFGHVRYVDLRGTLPHGARYRDWWANELHPTRAGFQRVARKIAATL